jgi:outer membrane protein assembly factor BamB
MLCQSNSAVTSQLVWTAGAALSGRPALGSDGRLRVLSRQGSLDVMDSSGELDFSVNLGASPTGDAYVDAKAWTYVGLATGKVVGISRDGRLQFGFPSPLGVRGNIEFAEGQGLLFADHAGQVIGINRGGYPTLRIDPKGRLTAGPVGVDGWCVLGTVTGDVVWGDRWGKRKRVSLGASIVKLAPLARGAIAAITERGLVVLSRTGEIAFSNPDVIAIAALDKDAAPNAASAAASVSTQPDNGNSAIALSALTVQGDLLWLTNSGEVRARAPMRRAVDPVIELSLDAEQRIWVTGSRHCVEVWQQDGTPLTVGEFPDQQFRPVFDRARGLAYIATVSGRVYRVTLPSAKQAS